MREPTIAANYASVLLELATRADNPEEWGTMYGDVAEAVERDPRLRQFLESPRVSEATKNAILGKAFQDRFPRLLVRFLQMLVHNRRQSLIRAIAVEYNRLLDQLQGRVHADVTVARPISDAEREAMGEQLTRSMGDGKRVTPVVRVYPRILGGVIVRIGDRVADGSVRTRLARLRQRLAAAT